MSRPVVAIVGRPNVGKSTLFNTLAGERISIVKDTPGVTRDRIYADVTWLNYNFTLIDTGGIEPESGDIILSQMREQAQIAIDTADVIMFIHSSITSPFDSFPNLIGLNSASTRQYPVYLLPGSSPLMYCIRTDSHHYPEHLLLFAVYYVLPYCQHSVR